jgi:hypothetical protein
MNKQITTIWKHSRGETYLFATIDGFPFGTPNYGTPVDLPQYGVATCTGRSASGSGQNETITEIRFTLDN